jgi:hypothetical protein
MSKPKTKISFVEIITLCVCGILLALLATMLFSPIYDCGTTPAVIVERFHDYAEDTYSLTAETTDGRLTEYVTAEFFARHPVGSAVVLACKYTWYKADNVYSLEDWSTEEGEP